MFDNVIANETRARGDAVEDAVDCVRKPPESAKLLKRAYNLPDQHRRNSPARNTEIGLRVRHDFVGKKSSLFEKIAFGSSSKSVILNMSPESRNKKSGIVVSWPIYVDHVRNRLFGLFLSLIDFQFREPLQLETLASDAHLAALAIEYGGDL